MAQQIDSRLPQGQTADDDYNINMGGFEMERILRQKAHEKAFEIQVLAQRSFE